MDKSEIIIAVISAILGSGVLTTIIKIITDCIERRSNNTLMQMRNDLYILYSICKQKNGRDVFDNNRFNDTYELYKKRGGNAWAEIIHDEFFKLNEIKFEEVSEVKKEENK